MCRGEGLEVTIFDNQLKKLFQYVVNVEARKGKL